MTTFTPAVAPSSERRDSRVQAAVIGSGFGGLAAAIRLQARGYHVHLFEMRDKPGGRAYVYQQDGFTFDAGPTIITAPFLIEELFTLAGRNIQAKWRARRLPPRLPIPLSSRFG